jgi:Kef-type K+ transport system membrane component KefB
MLMFLAGLEIDLGRIRGRPLNQALSGWLASLGLGVLLGFALTSVDGARSGLVVGMAVTTTALGTLLPILRDSGEVRTPFGAHVLAGAAVGELGPLVAVSLVLSTGSTARTVVILAAFVGITLAAAAVAGRPRGAWLGRLLDVTLTTSGQLVVRIVVLFVAVMIWVASELGLDVLLGAFAAGLVFRVFSAGASDREAELVEAKLQGFGFGFVVPVFFVMSGVAFDARSLAEHPLVGLAVPGFLAAFLVVRGGPSALLHRGPWSERAALAFYLATELPLVVVITSIGVANGRLPASTAAALVAAALVSVLVFPIVAARLRGPVDRSVPA